MGGCIRNYEIPLPPPKNHTPSQLTCPLSVPISGRQTIMAGQRHEWSFSYSSSPLSSHSAIGGTQLPLR